MIKPEFTTKRAKHGNVLWTTSLH
uniref:Uncharacterized protein n=1 Tax=Lepeophtheirus salmonis TaxID=72036 RepID=A0A0K2UI93_LEPSM